MPYPTKIALVDDHTLFRKALQKLIAEMTKTFDVIIEVPNGLELIEKLKKIDIVNYPDIVILDIHNPVMDGFETASYLRTHFPLIRIIALTMNNDETSILRMIQLGVHGYLLKTIEVPDLLSALDAALAGQFFYTDFATASLVNTLKQSNIEFPTSIENHLAVRKVWSSLPEKEKEFVKFSCSELKYPEIAVKMKVGTGTIHMYKQSVFKKFGVTSRISLVLLVFRYNL